MKTDIRDRWVEALRSGEYSQGYGELAIDGRYCCLGVLCEIAVQDGIVTKENIGSTDFVRYRSTSNRLDSGRSILPEAVKEWAGLDSINPSATRNGRGGTLSRFNDNGASFQEIAFLIEEQF